MILTTSPVANRETSEERRARVTALLGNVDEVPRPLLPVDAQWIQLVHDTMKSLGVNHEDVGNWIGNGQPALSQYLANPKGRSRMVWPISAALKIPLPLIARFELAMRKLDENGDVEGMAAAVTMAEALAGARQPKPPRG